MSRSLRLSATHTPDPDETDPRDESANDAGAQTGHSPESLGDTLQETRILLQGTQILVAFLIAVPFADRFQEVAATQKGVYLATFGTALTSLILFSAPAAIHRLARPLRDRRRYKRWATWLIVIGLFPLSASLVLATDMIVSLAVNDRWALYAAGAVAALIVACWWVVPILYRRSERDTPTDEDADASADNRRPPAADVPLGSRHDRTFRADRTMRHSSPWARLTHVETGRADVCAGRAEVEMRRKDVCAGRAEVEMKLKDLSAGPREVKTGRKEVCADGAHGRT